MPGVPYGMYRKDWITRMHLCGILYYTDNDLWEKLCYRYHFLIWNKVAVNEMFVGGIRNYLKIMDFF